MSDFKQKRELIDDLVDQGERMFLWGVAFGVGIATLVLLLVAAWSGRL